MVRAKIILSTSKNKLFEPFDRFAQLLEDQNRSIEELLNDFDVLRSRNIEELKSLQVTKDDLKLTGTHPELGTVTLQELLATWSVHDLGHITQISRVMAKQYKNEVGPWINYLGVLNK